MLFLYFFPHEFDSLRIFLIVVLFLYVLIISFYTLNISKGHPKTIFKTTLIIIGCHFFWSLGFILSPMFYMQNVLNYNKPIKKINS